MYTIDFFPSIMISCLSKLVDARAGGSLNAVRQAKGTRTGNRFTRTAQARPRSGLLI